ncbi:hypothetical protein [Desulforamulus hydrothermalis]|uniref:Uncharacterized protein n=1 Tax=Desulforamulus hydrothermalis Lam5 = DSM 18033 TaxID=1121428 RepID=K8DXJ7_9FIRM|nr:hypothetical protein [Desulforamulus hydrothermalis]CCO07275.1 conserved hypothetical protein [Desulforamulus hydrothermalis Lam5 = DSM 18033]SHG92920.1 hypothetical protein SAMN02745177_00822 [Desulforamulus hydrothermalis Lam5 = DSM 18033]
MWQETEELKQLCQKEIQSLRRQIAAARGSFFPRWDAKATIQKAEEKIEKIQQLLVKLDNLTEQVIPVINDIKEIIGVKQR